MGLPTPDQLGLRKLIYIYKGLKKIIMHSRRTFLQLTGLTAITNSFSNTFQNGSGSKPIVIATWDSGMGVCAEAFAILKNNGTALDAVETGAVFIENQINCCVGLGAYPDRDGIVTLDASIMDHLSNAGSVAGIEQIKNPIRVARKVMETTPHVMLVGAGAQQFAIENGFEKQDGKLSTDSEKAYHEWLKKSEYQPVINIERTKQNGPFAPYFFDDGTANHDTMGLVAMDSKGNLSGACTTSGMAFKIHGRVGDSPIIGAGLYVDNAVGAVTSSGVGEEVIKIVGSHLVTEFMRQGYPPKIACKKAIERIVIRDAKKAKSIQVGFIALNKKGEHGSFALQKGFQYAVHSNKEVQLLNTDYYFKQ
jgi:N4-(beta-N-acetylglucosaminyl)-L-asparaginase